MIFSIDHLKMQKWPGRTTDLTPKILYNLRGETRGRNGRREEKEKRNKKVIESREKSEWRGEE